jgi:hypothetical protein
MFVHPGATWLPTNCPTSLQHVAIVVILYCQGLCHGGVLPCSICEAFVTSAWTCVAGMDTSLLCFYGLHGYFREAFLVGLLCRSCAVADGMVSDSVATLLNSLAASTLRLCVLSPGRARSVNNAAIACVLYVSTFCRCLVHGAGLRATASTTCHRSGRRDCTHHAVTLLALTACYNTICARGMRITVTWLAGTPVRSCRAVATSARERPAASTGHSRAICSRAIYSKAVRVALWLSRVLSLPFTACVRAVPASGP